MSKYSFIGKFRTHVGKRDELLAILGEAAKGMSGVKGCQHYIVHKDLADENLIYVYELWDSKEDHDNSLKIEGTGELIAKAIPLMDGRPEVVELEPMLPL